MSNWYNKCSRDCVLLHLPVVAAAWCCGVPGMHARARPHDEESTDLPEQCRYASDTHMQCADELEALQVQRHLRRLAC